MVMNQDDIHNYNKVQFVNEGSNLKRLNFADNHEILETFQVSSPFGIYANASKDVLWKGITEVDRQQFVLTKPETHLPSSSSSDISGNSNKNIDGLFSFECGVDADFSQAEIGFKLEVTNNLFDQFEKTNRCSEQRQYFEMIDFDDTPKLDEPFNVVFNKAASALLPSRTFLSPNTVKKSKSEVKKNLTVCLKEEEETICKVSSKGKSLALRADVMNKNLIRALRRELKSIFDAYIAKSRLSGNKGKRVFNINLGKFSQYLLNTNVDLWKTRDDFSEVEFIKYLGIFLNICMMKKTLDSNEDKEKLSAFNDLLYGYSHKKFFDYLSVPEVSTIVKMIIANTSRESFISNHETLASNSQEYSSHLETVLGQI